MPQAQFTTGVAHKTRQAARSRPRGLNRVTIAILAFVAVVGVWAVLVAESKHGSPAAAEIAVLWIVFAGFLAYMLPTIVAWCLNHPHLLGILAINAVFGWTLIGWMAAMVWAVVPVAPVDRRRGTLVRFD